MNRRATILGAVLIVVVGVGAYKGYEHLEEKRAAQARLDAAIAVQLALAARKKAETVSQEAAEKLVTLAREGLDRGETTQARANLDMVLKSNPRNVAAQIEMARYHLLSGYINYRNYQPGAIDNAIWALTAALSVDPKSADVYVMLGHVQQQRGLPWQAISDLRKAETLGGETNPWLYLNWATALMDLNQMEAAEAKLRQAEGRFGIKAPPIRARLALHDKFSSLYTTLHKLDEADTHYKVHIALDPRAPWPRGNYANFLLFERGLPDAAIAEVEKVADSYGMAKLTFTAARYAKWAELKKKDPKRAAELLAAAKADTPDFNWIMPQAASSVGAGPAIEAMVRELVALGVPLDTKDEHGDTGMTLAAYTGKQRSVELLSKMGASIETRDNDGQTALIMAARRGHVNVAKALHARKARVNVQDSAGKSALHHAVGDGNEAMVRALIGMKINVNLASTTGYTALMMAAWAGNPQITQVLLAAGADASAITVHEKRTAADLAEAQGHKDLAEQLRRTANSK